MGKKTTLVVFRWNAASKGAREIATGLKAKLLRADNSTLIPRPNMFAINWGATQHPLLKDWLGGIWNRPEHIIRTQNKLSFFQLMTSPGGPRLPPWTTDFTEALSWFKKKEEVVARLVLNGSSGHGIYFFSDDNDQLTQSRNAKLFTKYVKKKEEYRVHLFRDEIIDCQRKMLRLVDDAGVKVDPEQVDFRIRNLANGFVFGDREHAPPKDVLLQAKKAMALSGLDFGAVDVIYNEKEDQAYVLEINTAPGLMGTTLEKYLLTFQNKLKEEGITL